MDLDTKRLCCPDLQGWGRPPRRPWSVRSVDGGFSGAPACLSPNGFSLSACCRGDLQELGFSYVEMNASCTRSKSSLKDVVAESVDNTSIENFYKGELQHFNPFYSFIYFLNLKGLFGEFRTFPH